MPIGKSNKRIMLYEQTQNLIDLQFSIIYIMINSSDRYISFFRHFLHAFRF